MKSSSRSEAFALKKQMEADERMLANRIKLLELEEQRTYKKVEETRKKTQQVHQVRRLKHTQRLAYRDFIAQQQAALEQLHITRQRERSLRLSVHHRATTAVYQSRRQASQPLQQQLEHYKQKQQLNEALQRSALRNRVQTAQREAETRAERRHHFYAKRLQDCRQECQKRLEADWAVVKAREKDLEEMERLESQLIEKLQHSRLTHKQALEDLELITAHTSRFADANV